MHQTQINTPAVSSRLSQGDTIAHPRPQFPYEEAKAQRVEVAGPRSHSREAASDRVGVILRSTC